MINKALITLRVELGLSLAQAAAAIGIHAEVLRAYETGGMTPWSARGWADNAVLIAEYHGVSPDCIWEEGANDRRRAEGEVAGEWLFGVSAERVADRREERVRVHRPVQVVLSKKATSQAN